MASTRGTSLDESPGAIGIAEKSNVMPKTRAMLAIFEPSTFPTAISGALSRAAMADTTISGADVPKATNVIPMIIGFTFIFSATRAECSMNLSELITSKINPAIRAAENSSITSKILTNFKRPHLMRFGNEIQDLILQTNWILWRGDFIC